MVNSVISAFSGKLGCTDLDAGLKQIAQELVPRGNAQSYRTREENLYDQG